MCGANFLNSSDALNTRGCGSGKELVQCTATSVCLMSCTMKRVVWYFEEGGVVL